MVELHSLDYRKGQPVVTLGPILPKSEAIWVANVEKTICVISLSDGVVLGSTLLLDSKNELKLLYQNTLFEPKKKAYLISLQRMASKEFLAPMEKNEKGQPELVVDVLPHKVLSVRAGRIVQFCSLKGGALEPNGKPIELPCFYTRRMTRAMPLAKGKVAYLIVLRAGEQGLLNRGIDVLTASRIDLFTIEREEGATTKVKSCVLKRSTQIDPMAVSCGREPVLWSGSWYVVATNEIFVIGERDGRLVETFSAGWRPNAIRLADDSLLIMTDSGQVRVFDLIDG